jgi:hypothetical protein
MPGLNKLVRPEQTQRELTRLAQAISDWSRLRTERDVDEMNAYAGLHKTRLTAITNLLSAALDALAHELDGPIPEDPYLLYEYCRALDRSLVWLERVWAYYRDKFDQRDPDSAYAPLLKAADEVVWSCYKQAFLNPNRLPAGVAIQPAPLAYIAPDYSPATWEADKLAPAELRPGSEIEGLEELFLTLPVPVIRLPPWCLSSPWWLAFAAHETGHNIQRELKLVDSFGLLLQTAVVQTNRPQKPDGERWKRWGAEIFADLFSIAMLGSWAVRALLEVELSTPQRMSVRRSEYPAALVRLELCARAAGRMGFDRTAALAGLDIQSLANQPDAVDANQDMAVLDPLLDAALGPLWEGGPTLEELLGLDLQRQDFLAGGKTASWAAALTGALPVPVRGLPNARFITAGAVMAWEKANQLPGLDQRKVALDKIAANTMTILRRAGPEGVRAKPLAVPETRAFGSSLAALLLANARKSPEG